MVNSNRGLDSKGLNLHLLYGEQHLAGCFAGQLPQFSKRFCQRELSDRSSAYPRTPKGLTLTFTKQALTTPICRISCPFSRTRETPNPIGMAFEQCVGGFDTPFGRTRRISSYRGYKKTRPLCSDETSSLLSFSGQRSGSRS